MKKSIIGIAAVLLVVCTGLAYGNEKEGVEVEAGVKGWYNKLELKDPDGTLKFDSTMLLGPAVEVKLPDHIFFEASYLMSLADYKYSQPVAKVELERKDFDIAAGYQLIPQLAVYAGYKSATSDSTATSIFGDRIDATTKLYGFLVGLRGNVPVSETVSVYANAAYLKTRSQFSDFEVSETEAAPGYDVELGLKLQIAKQVSGSLGWRRESTKGKVSKEEETFSGVTFGALYAFE